MLKLKCPICNENGYLYKKLKQLDLYFCKSCKHRYTNESSIKKPETYSEDYYKKKHENWFNNPNYILFEKIYKIIKSTGLEYPDIIDVGCGNGDLLRFLAKKNKTLKLTGVDYYKNKSNENITFLSGDIFNIKFDKKYDFVINFAIIEHVGNIQRYINYLINLCKNDGVIITMTINDDSILYNISRIIHSFGFREPMERIYDPHHLNHFSQKSLELLFKKNSMVVKEIIFTNVLMKSINYPNNNIFFNFIYKISLIVIFKLEKFFNKNYLQTICAIKKF